MRMETVEQILKVIDFAAQKFRQGYGIEQSYQYGVSRTSREYNVAYQTIGDACRRRLDLDRIEEFKMMLKATLEGNPTDLQNLLVRKTSNSYHERINEFFLNLKNSKSNPEKRQSDTFVSYTIQLRKNDSDVLRALSQLQGEQPEKILAELSIDAVKERMKQAVSKL